MSHFRNGSVISDYRMVDFMKKTADNHKISWQPEVLPAGGTDSGGIQKYGKKGAITGAISIPTRYIHQTIEMANKKDIHDCIELLTACISDLDSYDWSFK